MGVRLHQGDEGRKTSDCHRTLLELSGVSSTWLELELSSTWHPPTRCSWYRLFLLHDSRTKALLLAYDRNVEVRQLAAYSEPVRLAVYRLLPVHLRHGREKHPDHCSHGSQP